MYLFRAVDSHGQTVDFYLSETRDREAAKLFLMRALGNGDNRPPRLFARAAIRPPSGNCAKKVFCIAVADNEHGDTLITGSNPTTAPSSDGCGLCKDRVPR